MKNYPVNGALIACIILEKVDHMECGMRERFFDESQAQSRLKASIVTKYFWVWANVVKRAARTRTGRIAYIDLFAGPGRYEDGTKSTPLLVLEQAIKDPDMREMLVTIFNDGDPSHVESLRTSVASLPGIEKLKHSPVFINSLVGPELRQQFEKMNFLPTFFFVDPWGYKGLSLQLIHAVVKDWGCDCVFFFNYNRINMGLNNPAVEEHMNELFGSERATEVRKLLEGLSPTDRELMIVEQISQALKEKGPRYVLPFGFRNEQGTRTTHHLFFVSKAFRGYEIMKGIMAKESSIKDQGVPSFNYSPADKRMPLLFSLSRPLDHLRDALLEDFAGRTATMRAIYEEHNLDRPFVEANYKEALKQLEEAGKIRCSPPASKRQRNTMGPDVIVAFPTRSA